MQLAALIQRWGLLRVFALSSFVSIVGISIASGYIYFSFLQQNLLQREMVISSEFIQSVSLIIKPEAYFKGSTSIEEKEAVEEFFYQVSGISEVFRVNVYDADYKIIWSTDDEVIGKTFRDNGELDLAYRGRSIFNRSEMDEHEKQEHGFLPQGVDRFIESYIPVRDENKGQIIGVVELYKSPSALFEILERGRNLVVWVSLLGGLVLYGLLFGIVRVAHQQIETHRNRIKQASSRAVELNEQSLRRISSELQDGPVQSIEAAMSKLDSIVEKGVATQSAAKPDQTAVDKIRISLQDALKQILSISLGLQIPELKELSAREVVLKVIDRHEESTSTRVGKQIDQMPETLNNATKICIYRLLQEGLKNAFRRGEGIGQYVGISVERSRLILSIGESGAEIDTDGNQVGHESEGLELRGMRERIQSLGGEFYVYSDERNRMSLLAYLPMDD